MIGGTQAAIVGALDWEPEHSKLEWDLVDFKLFFVLLMTNDVFVNHFGIYQFKHRFIEIGLRLALLLVLGLLLHELRLIVICTLGLGTKTGLLPIDHDTGDRRPILDFPDSIVSSLLQ